MVSWRLYLFSFPSLGSLLMPMVGRFRRNKRMCLSCFYQITIALRTSYAERCPLLRYLFSRYFSPCLSLCTPACYGSANSFAHVIAPFIRWPQAVLSLYHSFFVSLNRICVTFSESLSLVTLLTGPITFAESQLYSFELDVI